ncbi:MAG: S8 family serine peptidase [Cyanobacteria bacterium P01_F01_bin.150]
MSVFNVFNDRISYANTLGLESVFEQDFEGFSRNSNLEGVEFLPGVTATSNLPRLVAFGGSDGTSLFGLDRASVSEDSFYEVNFSQLYNAVGFDIASFDPNTPGPAVVDVTFADGDTTSINIFPSNATESDPIFFGLIADTPISRIRVTEGPEIGGVDNEEIALDNFAIANIIDSQIVEPPTDGCESSPPKDGGGDDNAVLKGSKGNDRLVGGDGDDILKGRKGNDRLIGKGGDDLLIGGRGRDKHRGGLGNDTFLFKRSDLKDRPDVILDFEVGTDVLDMSRVLKGDRFRSDTPFDDFVRIKGSSKRTVVQVDVDGVGDRQKWKSLVVLKGVDFNTVDIDSLIDNSENSPPEDGSPDDGSENSPPEHCNPDDGSENNPPDDGSPDDGSENNPPDDGSPDDGSPDDGSEITPPKEDSPEDEAISLEDDLGLQDEPIQVSEGVWFLGEGIHPDDLNIVRPTNIRAADTTNTEQLQPGGSLGLNLTGSGLTVGIWEAVERGTNSWRVRNTHEQLNGRVNIVDSGTGFSNHATHVAGTIGGTGAIATNPSTDDNNARGMATQVNLRSYSAGDDIAELNRDARLLDASNHSYGFAQGWQFATRQTTTNGSIVSNIDVWLQDYSISSREDVDYGKYNAISQSLDQVLFSNPNLLSVWSAGNERNDRLSPRRTTFVTFFSSDPNIPGVNWRRFGAGWYQVPTALVTAPGSDGNAGTGYDSISDFSTAKNNLVVGAINDIQRDPYTNRDVVITSFSSWGPTDDGRVKPDVVANGSGLLSSVGTSDTTYGTSSGTSMAAPNVTGTAVLLIEHYQNLFGTKPRSATTKGLLTHTAFDAGNVGPDYTFGWGVVDATAAANFLTNAVNSDLSNNGELISGNSDFISERTYSGSIETFEVASDGSNPLKATIVWTDPAGTPQGRGLDVNTPVLVNDLDMIIVETKANGSTSRWNPWTLDPSNPNAAAVRTTRNRVDNIEQVVIDNPNPSSTYDIVIGGPRGVTQNYTLLVSGHSPRLTSQNSQLWNQDRLNLTSEEGDGFGSSLTSGDFNNDGFDDLVVGVPGEDFSSLLRAGEVNVIYGSNSGLTSSRRQQWSQNSPGIADSAESGEFFGSELTTGDFDGDGFDDLVVGIPEEDIGSIANGGGANVIYGSIFGLSSFENQFWSQDSPGIQDAAERDPAPDGEFSLGGDYFGRALASGDFDNDGFDDLAVGVPGEDLDAGAVNVIFGSSNGLTATGNQLWSQDSVGILNGKNEDDEFGSVLAAGDFDNDGFEDLAISVPGEDIGSVANAGAVSVIYGSSNGLTATGNQLWSQNSFGILETAEFSDRFGEALAVGDFDNDGFDDLAIGVADEDINGSNSIAAEGGVHIIYGASDGLTATGNQFWSQNTAGIQDTAEFRDDFGSDLVVGDFNGDGYDDLSIGAPGENTNAGQAHIIYGSPDGLTRAGNQVWSQNSPGVEGISEGFVDNGRVSGDVFAAGLGAGDFNGNGAFDLAIGAPRENFATPPGLGVGEGTVNVLYGVS